MVVLDDLQNEIIRKIHKKGNFAAAKIGKVLEQEIYIAKARNRAENAIANCIKCILHSKKQRKGLLNPIPKENIPLNTYHIDFVNPPSVDK